MLNFKEKLKKITDLQVYINLNLSKYTTYKTGGKAEIAVFPTELHQLSEIIRLCNDWKVPLTVLGGGSNVLISDKGISGLTLLITEMNKFKVFENILETQCGVASADISKIAYKYSLSGAEFLSDLPGSIGGAAYMNARAFGSEIADILSSATVIDSKGNIINYSFKKEDFSYKKSPFKQNKLIIADLKFKLNYENPNIILNKMKNNSKHRQKNGESEVLSCGCVFKNPYYVGISAGKLIDELGLKTFGTKHVRIYEKHANFIVNDGYASSTEIRKLMDFVKYKVKNEKYVDLEFEVEFLGDWNDYSFNRSKFQTIVDTEFFDE